MGVDPISMAFLAVAAVGTGASIYQRNEANKYQKRAVEDQRRSSNLQLARQQRDAVRQSRFAMAQATVAAENQGVSGSSSAQGGQASIVSQMSSNLSFLDQYGFLSDQASRNFGKASELEGNAQMWSDIADAAVVGYSNSASISKAAKKVFKT